MEQLRPNSRSPLSALSLDQSRQFGQKPTMNQVGKAFETLFMQTMLKSMRDAQLEDGLLDSEHSKPFQSMLDGIYSEMSVKRTNLGLAEAINRQFSPTAGARQQTGAGAPEAALNAARSAAMSGNIPAGIGGNSPSRVAPLPLSDLTASLSAQQSTNLKATRPLDMRMSMAAPNVAPKLKTGD